MELRNWIRRWSQLTGDERASRQMVHARQFAPSCLTQDTGTFAWALPDVVWRLGCPALFRRRVASACLWLSTVPCCRLLSPGESKTMGRTMKHGKSSHSRMADDRSVWTTVTVA